MFKLLNLSLAFAIIFFSSSAKTQTPETTPDLREIFSNPVLTKAVIDAVDEDKKIPNFLLNNLLQIGINRSLEIEDLGLLDQYGNQRVQNEGSRITLTTNSSSQSNVYYTLQIVLDKGNIFIIQWCANEDPSCCRIFDGQGNAYAMVRYREWDLFSGGFDENSEKEMREALIILLNK